MIICIGWVRRQQANADYPPDTPVQVWAAGEGGGAAADLCPGAEGGVGGELAAQARTSVGVAHESMPMLFMKWFRGGQSPGAVVPCN